MSSSRSICGDGGNHDGKQRDPCIRRAGALGGLTAIIWVGLATTAVRASVPRIHPSGLTAAQFSDVGVMSLALFAVFLALGIACRRRPALHKRYIVLAMIGVLTPAASRILTLLGLREHWVYLVPVLPALFVVWCLVNDWRKYGFVHPVYAIGGAAITAAWRLRLMMGRAEWYQPVGGWFARRGRPSRGQLTGGRRTWLQ